MACSIPSPSWDSLTEQGLVSASENIADGYINLDIASASTGLPSTIVFYNIYVSSVVNNIFNFPLYTTTENLLSVPATILNLNQYIAVRASVYGFTSDFIAADFAEVSPGLFLLPSPTETIYAADINTDGYLVVQDASGYPENDGYLLINAQIIGYDEIVDNYLGDGYSAFVGLDLDPFGCEQTHGILPSGSAVQIFSGFEEGNVRRLKPRALCGLPEITWPGETGIKRVSDLGIGRAIKIEWNTAKAPAGFTSLFYNIYLSDTVRNLYGKNPIAFASGNEAIINNLFAGKPYYVGVKASYQINTMDLPNFNLLGNSVYEYPVATVITAPFSISAVGSISVDSTEGYPLFGYLKIGSEILEYNGITSTSFNITNRDVFSIGLRRVYMAGDTAVFFKGIEDRNSLYYRSTPSWDAGVGTPYMPLPDGYNGVPADGYNGRSYYQDEDGYRSTPVDLNTEDRSRFEDQFNDNELLGRCSYHRENWDRYFSRTECGTYAGGLRSQIIPGVNNNMPVLVGGGIDPWEHATRTEEDLLSKTGEMFILLRRKRTGRKCPSLSIRTEHPHARCGLCFGTTFEHGYDRYLNTRTIIQGQPNPNGFIMMRVSPYKNDLELSEEQGLRQIDELDAWTISMPVIKDRDIIIRYIYDIENQAYIEDYRYEVLDVNRNMLLFNRQGKQQIRLKKLDRTREIYKFDEGNLLDLPGIPVLPG